MTTITTRAGKGSPLTNNEMDANLTGLNDDKVEASGDSMTGNLSFGDNNKAIFGGSQDLQIYHDGSHSYIDDAGTGLLRLRSNTVYLEKYTGELLADFNADGYVSLLHDNSEKFRTTSTGIDVTGTVTADSATIDGAVSVTGSLTTNQDITISETIPRLVLDDTSATDNIGIIRQANSNLVLEAQGGTSTYGGIQLKRSNGTDTSVLDIEPDGDVVFYADNGTTKAFFWDAGESRLGLNTTSPTTVLDVTGGAIVSPTGVNYQNYTSVGDLQIADTASTGLLIHSGTTSSGYVTFGDGAVAGRIHYDHSADEMYISTNNSIAATIDSSGQVGIGTQSPSYLVDAQSSGDAAIRIRSTGTGASDDSLLRMQIAGTTASNIIAFGDSGSSFAGEIRYTHNNNSLSFDTNGAEAIRIDSSGRVGIGTQSPLYELHIEDASGNAVVNIESSTTGYSAVNLGDTNNDDVGQIKYDNSTNSMQFTTNATEAIRIDSSGNLLVGTTDATPYNNTSGNGIALGDGLITSAKDGGIAAIFNRMTSDGDVVQFRKDGTTVGSIATNSSRFELDGSGNPVRMKAGTSNIQVNNNTHISFDTAGSEAARFDSSGNLFVATTSDVVGDTSGTGLSYASGYLAVSRDGSSPTAAVQYLNRTGVHGQHLQIRYEGSSVGHIGSNDNDPFIARTGGNGFRWYSGAVVPTNDSGATADNVMDLGSSIGRFKNLYLSGIDVQSDAINQQVASNWYIRNRVSGGVINLGVETSGGALYYPISISGTGDTTKFRNSTGEMARFDANGRLLVGKTSQVYTTVGVQLGNYSSNSIDNTTQFTHNNSGGTSVACTAPVSESCITFHRQDTGAFMGHIRNDSSNSVSYFTSSDERLKENIVDAPSASDDIDAIQIRSFDWKADGSHQKYGVIAQELNNVIPSAVDMTQDENRHASVDLSKLVPMLVKEIQSLRARVAQLEGAN